MKALRKLLDNIKPKFEGNKYLHTIFDALETFLFTPREVTVKGSHIRDGIDMKRTMIYVVLALQLCYLFGSYNMGHQHYAALGITEGLFDMWGQKLLYGLLQLLPLFVVVHVVGLGIEFIFAALRGHAVEEGFLVTGALIPLIMPPDVPLWMVAIATAFAVVIGKEAFGGTGMNFLNIALLTRVFIFFAYPIDISGDIVWVSYDYSWLHSFVNTVIGGDFLKIASGSAVADGFSGATPLALAAKGGWSNVMQNYTVDDMLWGWIPGSIGEMSKIACIAGAGFLVMTGIGSWRIMVSMIVGCATMGLIFNVFAPSDTSFLAVPFQYHFLMGGFWFAMAFMATDPVTAASTDLGKLIYGFLIGMVGLIIRVTNPAYPEGWMMAILLMNVMAPLIDHYVIQANINRRLSHV
ncbi:MAG: NADH:ubiquinone reductase (Na(+)-transporting) subunit B [Bacteroidetes bacterium]|nr:NADH:ubiquinone reductase (Na(+)-transporting) subunit B [Bacteroidota bacterium]